MITLNLCARRDPTMARNCGWTKNHLLVEFYWLDKWRVVGFFTRKQIERGKHIERARKKLIANAPMSEDEANQVNFNFYFHPNAS